jgi:3-oxoacyl-[acyl-carrier protein] reductase
VTSKSAIVTGASAGIGLAVATELCRLGFAVTMAARGHERLDAAATTLLAAGHDVQALALDMTATDAAAQLVDAHVRRYEQLDVVVANAGWGTYGSVATSRPGDLERMMQANVTAPFALAAAALPFLRRATAPAWFVVTASISGTWPTAGFAGYSATKAAAISLARSIATEEVANGVRACAICPAFVDTDMTSWLGDQLAAEQMLTAHDVAESVRYLLSLSPSASVTELVLRRAGAPDPFSP